MQPYLNKDARKYQNTGNELDEEIRIVIIGKTGTGKSATGNTILGMNKFESKACGASVTNKCKLGINRRFDRKIVLVDTPGLFDTEMTNEHVTKEIVKCMGMTAPGPHAILLTVNIGRFTKEEQDTVKHFVDYFGNDMYNYLLVVFTRADDLENENTTIESYVKEGPPELKAIVELCNNRYIAFNNRLRGIDQEHQVKRLISIIDDIVRKNESSCFTNDMYMETEKTLLRQEQEMKKTIQEEEKRIIEEIRNQLKIKSDKRFVETQYENDHLAREISEENNKIPTAKAKGMDTCNFGQQQFEKSRENNERIEQLKKQIEENKQKMEKEIEMLRKEIEQKEKIIKDEYEQRQNSSNLRDNNRESCDKETGVFSQICTVLKKGFKVIGSLAFLLPDGGIWATAKKTISAVNSNFSD
ncbi:hypothetical protein KUTeg_009805 [Tegillarca granosa]|uniref:AIG1-type G domain-containing protein n=1 Tax=Tegillarca granosa TaxID=220873 RepID=A0ABQ9F975_TEGGR|nr:hypothetical protein KUTeg_009805 [Tegillarca granosa]